MAYRTKKEPGPDPKGNRLLGLKITTGGEMAINKYEKDAWAVVDKVRSGATVANNGTYKVNGKTCNHSKAGSKKFAVAWWKDKDYVYVEALLEHTGKDNDYKVV